MWGDGLGVNVVTMGQHEDPRDLETVLCLDWRGTQKPTHVIKLHKHTRSF